MLASSHNISSETVESDSTSISASNLISRINSLNKKRNNSGESDNDSAYKSQESFNTSNTEYCNLALSTPTQSTSDVDVSDLTRKFGGGAKKKLEKIRAKVSKKEEDRTVLESKQSRGDCFPALVFMMTPIVVVIL